MKKTFISSFLGLVISGLLLASCSQMASYENDDLLLEQARTDKEGFKLSPLGNNSIGNARVYEGADCSSDCIVAGSGDYFIKTDSQTGSAGPNSKEVTYRAYNTETDFVVEVDYVKTSGNSNAKADITITIEGDDLLIEDVPFGSTVSHSIALPEGWVACDELEFSILQEALGNPISWDESYSLFAVCSEECEEEFSYSADEGSGTIQFSYTPSESATGANLVFTFAQSAVVEMEGFTRNGATMQGVFDLEACVTYEFTATVVTLRCTGNGQTAVNVWTDFGVEIGEEEKVSKKNDDTPNIKWECTGS